MSKKIIVVGSGGVGRTTLAEQVLGHDSIHDVTICETKPKYLKEMEDLQTQLAGAMLSAYAGKWKEKGSNKTPKKKKRKKKGKKTHR